MIKKVILSKRGMEPFLILSVVSAVCFNNWILGFWLNHKLFSLDGSISEFSSSGQPHAALFRGLDILSGLLIAALALWWSRTECFNKPGAKIIFLGALILGIANAADAIMPLSCSVTLSSACNLPISLSIKHPVIPGHAYSSTAIAIGMFLLPIGGWLYAKSLKLRSFMVISQAVFVLNVLIFGAILWDYFTSGVSVQTSGLGQEIQMLAIGIWIITWGYTLKLLA